jgi:hypothetical protein
VQVKEMLFEVFKTRSLGHVIRELVQVAEPELVVLPVSESDCLHKSRIVERENEVNAAASRSRRSHPYRAPSRTKSLELLGFVE